METAGGAVTVVLAGRRAPPWCAGASGTVTSHGTQRHRRRGPPRKKARRRTRESERPGLGSSEVSPERAVVTLAEHVRAQPRTHWPPSGMHRRSVTPCPRRYSTHPATYQEHPSLRSAGGAVAGDGRAEMTHELAERPAAPCITGPAPPPRSGRLGTSVRGTSPGHRPSRPGSQRQLLPALRTYYDSDTGGIAPSPGGGGVWGMASPPPEQWRTPPPPRVE